MKMKTKRKTLEMALKTEMAKLWNSMKKRRNPVMERKTKMVISQMMKKRTLNELQRGEMDIFINDNRVSTYRLNRKQWRRDRVRYLNFLRVQRIRVMNRKISWNNIR